jgi:hypothetical protein
LQGIFAGEEENRELGGERFSTRRVGWPQCGTDAAVVDFKNRSLME